MYYNYRLQRIQYVLSIRRIVDALIYKTIFCIIYALYFISIFNLFSFIFT